MTQFFNSKNAPVFKKILQKTITYHLSCVFENTINGTYFKGMFFSYFFF
jgi:S-adenosylmethionine:diacylglycerol 3-amino-3-carboxypropyl transferase